MTDDKSRKELFKKIDERLEAYDAKKPNRPVQIDHKQAEIYLGEERKKLLSAVDDFRKNGIKSDKRNMGVVQRVRSTFKEWKANELAADIYRNTILEILQNEADATVEQHKLQIAAQKVEIEEVTKTYIECVLQDITEQRLRNKIEAVQKLYEFTTKKLEDIEKNPDITPGLKIKYEEDLIKEMHEAKNSIVNNTIGKKRYNLD